jgi:general secretion pathway protein G
MTTSKASRRASCEAGFTLLELLVVLAILGLLAAIVAPQVLKYLGAARTTAARTQIQGIESAAEHFDADVGRYPSSEEGLEALVKQPAGVANWNGPYMKKDSGLTDPWGQKYIYANPGKHGDVDIYSLGADHAPGGTGEAADVGNW